MVVKDNFLRSTRRHIKYLMGTNKKTPKRLKFEIQQPQGGKEMIKGISKRIIVVKSPDPTLFDEAIFIIRDEAFNRKNAVDVMRDAETAVADYMKRTTQSNNSIIAKISPQACVAAGAAVTGVAWLFVSLIGF